MTKFESAVLEEVARLRHLFAACDLHSLHFRVNASGRVDAAIYKTFAGDNIKIKFSVGENSYGDTVDGNSVDEVMTEFLRRKGWNEKNDGLALPYLPQAQDKAPVSAQPKTDEIPF